MADLDWTFEFCLSRSLEWLWRWVVSYVEAAYEKKHPPELDDEVWRLDSIRKDGTFHKHLILLNISTVEQFLRFETMQPGKLRQVSPFPAIVHLLLGIVTCTVSSFLSGASSFLVCLQDMDLTNFSVEFLRPRLGFCKESSHAQGVKKVGCMVSWPEIGNVF